MAAFPDMSRGGVGVTDPMIYLLKHAGSVDKFNQLADKMLGEGRWRVLAWVPENRLRFVASVDSRTGWILGLLPILPEEMPGDSLSQDRARQLVDGVLTKQGEDLSKLDLKSQSTQNRPHRLDHSFTYEARDGDPRNVADAKYRRGGSVEGSWLHVGAGAWYKIPEAWQRDREASTVIRTAKSALSYIVMIGLAVWAIGILTARMRRGFVPWKRALVYAILPAAVYLVAGLNQFYLAKSDYFGMVATPWSVFRTGLIVQWLISAGIIYVYFAVGLATLSALYPDALPWLRRVERRAAWFDALVASAGAIGGLLIVRSFSVWLAAWKPEWVVFTGWNTPEWLPAPAPVFMMLAGAFSRALLTALLFAFFAYLWQGPMKKPILRIALLIAAVVMLFPGSSPDANEWVYSLLVNIGRVGLTYVALRFFVSGRPVLLVSVASGLAIVNMAMQGLGTGNGYVLLNTWIFVGISLAVLIYWLLGSRDKAVTPSS